MGGHDERAGVVGLVADALQGVQRELDDATVALDGVEAGLPQLGEDRAFAQPGQCRDLEAVLEANEFGVAFCNMNFSVRGEDRAEGESGCALGGADANALVVAAEADVRDSCLHERHQRLRVHEDRLLGGHPCVEGISGINVGINFVVDCRLDAGGDSALVGLPGGADSGVRIQWPMGI